MHLAFIATPDLSYVSGSSLSLRYTVEALGQLGVDCTVFCQRAPIEAGRSRVRYVELPMPLDYQVITDSTPSSTDLMSCLNHLVNAVVRMPKVDIVHAIYGTFTGAAAVIAGALRSAPVVISTFGRDLTLGAVVDPRYRKLMKISYGHADLVVAADETSARLVSEGYAGPLAEVCIVPPGMNFGMLRQAAKRRPKVKAGARLLAVQSSFNEQKGLGLLVEAFAEVIRSVPTVELVVVGHDDTPNARIEENLRRQVDRLGLADKVRFIGHLSHEMVAATMVDCDLLVDPRVINSFSSCVYEAMATGLIVVASDVPCNRYALQDGKNGILTRAGDVDDLAAGILSVLNDQAFAVRLLRAGAAHADIAAAEFDCEVVAGKLHQRYLSLLSARSLAEATSCAPTEIRT